MASNLFFKTLPTHRRAALLKFNSIPFRVFFHFAYPYLPLHITPHDASINRNACLQRYFRTGGPILHYGGLHSWSGGITEDTLTKALIHTFLPLWRSDISIITVGFFWHLWVLWTPDSAFKTTQNLEKRCIISSHGSTLHFLPPAISSSFLLILPAFLDCPAPCWDRKTPCTCPELAQREPPLQRFFQLALEPIAIFFTQTHRAITPMTVSQ